ncbi:outer membrane beta-barrel protein [Immundisolibacter sp.]|uniref:outer membrane beta-barrel protein n=1 Tax=Immundisolibacter sp. TaxID=1934948 RepID=UPI002627F7DB|nr:outer membrane beta-barrel protein [Immundisolibacter sp.]MDD3651283.1 outer membrane beta-barrel protein [Immundisolibacter sp.]
MKKANFISTLVAAGTLGIAGAALAAPADTSSSAWFNPKFYLGGGVSFAKIDDVTVHDTAIDTGKLKDFDDDRWTWQAFGGVMVNPWLGVEAGYLDVPEFENKGFDIDGNGYTASVLLAAPLGERFAVYAKGGRVWWDVDVDGPLGVDKSVEGSDWLYGAGVKVAVLPNLSLRLEYTRYELDDNGAEGDLDLATAGVQFNF